MWRALLSPLILLPLFTTPRLTAACPCVIQFGVCDEARQSDAVFIGTVESVAPRFLDPFARAKAMASMPSAAETARLQMDPSPTAFEKLKKIYLDMFTGLPDLSRKQLVEAATPEELQTAFEALQSEGRVAHFNVRALYKREADDDGTKDDKDDDMPASLDVWTGGGDCGFDFQVGETYLVYALTDEDSGKLETSICMRTRRLSEDRGDLGFLYFMRNAEKESTRLEGFVSTSFGDQNLPRYEDKVSSPLPGATLELDTGAGMRYTESNVEGRFSFDGLKAGDYRLSLLGPGFPRAPRTVILSHTFHAKEGSCPRQIFILPQARVRPSSP